jgi:hypothetical protein
MVVTAPVAHIARTGRLARVLVGQLMFDFAISFPSDANVTLLPSPLMST